jgi:hypothetical protein
MAIDPNTYFNESIMMERAKEMLAQNTPIEMVAQQTGLPRDLVMNLYNSQANIQRPTVSAPPTSMGLGELSSQLDTAISGGQGNLGTDISDYLTNELGFDPLQDDDSPMSLKQLFNVSNARHMLDSTDTQGVEDILNSQKLIEDANFDDKELADLYRTAISNYLDFDYSKLVQTPDEGLPWLVAGASLAESGAKGENWGTALSRAIIGGLTTKKKEEIRYGKEVGALDLKRQQAINDITLQFSMLDYKNKAQLNSAIKQSQLKAPKMYDIVGPSGTFADKVSIPLDEISYGAFARSNPGAIRPQEKSDLKPYTLTTDDGKVLNTYLDEDQLKSYIGNPVWAGKILEGHPKQTNMKRYMVKDPSGTKLPNKYYTPDQYNDLVAQGYSLTPLPSTETAKAVIRKDNNEAVFITQEELLDNPTAYRDTGGFSMSVGADGEVTMGYGSTSLQNTAMKKGDRNFEAIRDTMNGTQTAYKNYFISAESQDKLIEDFLKQNPGADDLPFNNLAGRAVKLADDIRVNISSFANMFTKDTKDGGYSFYLNADVGKAGDKTDFNKFKENIMSSAEFEEYSNSPFFKFLEANGIAREAVEATAFDLAMLGAASYSPNKGGVDLRAISDFETKQFMKVQGTNASTLKGYRDIANRFRRNLIDRNINFLEQQIQPINLVQITDKNGQQDITRQNMLKENATKQIDYLKSLKIKYSDSYFGSSSGVPTTKTYVGDKTIDGDNEDVVEFNIDIPLESNFSQQYNLSKPYNTDTLTELEGSFRELLNKYESLKYFPQELAAFEDNLRSNLSEEEFIVFRAMLTAAQKKGS